jgi:hypothetical protein
VRLVDFESEVKSKRGHKSALEVDSLMGDMPPGALLHVQCINIGTKKPMEIIVIYNYLLFI